MESSEFEHKMTCLLFALKEFLSSKDIGYHFDFSSMFMTKGPYPDSSSTQKKPLYEYVEPRQITQLLDILKGRYKCLDFSEKPYYKTTEELLETAFKQKKLSEYENEVELIATVKKLSEQKKYSLLLSESFEERFDDVFRKFTSAKTNNGVLFALHLEERKDFPVLYINDTPIRKFKNTDSYPYKLMKLALSLPNGSVIPAKDLLKISRGNRGCSQDLSEIFGSPVIKSVFTREITNSSFRIYHEITEEDLNEVSYFKKAPITDKSNTEHFAKMIEECRISP
ncbi:hypothetical protein IKF92_01320 [Candidatus Saccharibacteria bacterium]|nr:hypothetical protein [Candidatus Saccharibacteria bacterium]